MRIGISGSTLAGSDALGAEGAVGAAGSGTGCPVSARLGRAPGPSLDLTLRSFCAGPTSTKQSVRDARCHGASPRSTAICAPVSSARASRPTCVAGWAAIGRLSPAMIRCSPGTIEGATTTVRRRRAQPQGIWCTSRQPVIIWPAAAPAATMVRPMGLPIPVSNAAFSRALQPGPPQDIVAGLPAGVQGAVQAHGADGECARLVAAQHIDAAQALDGVEPPHQQTGGGGQPARAVRQRHTHVLAGSRSGDPEFDTKSLVRAISSPRRRGNQQVSAAAPVLP